MGLLDDLNNETNFVHPRRAWCSVCKLIESLPKAEGEAFASKLLEPHITNTALSRVLKANGHDVSDGTISRHRRKECHGVS